MKRLLLLGLGGGLLTACQPEPPATTAAPEAAAHAATVAPAPPPRPRYEGTYRDTACDLSIRITRRDTSYFFACDSVRGPVQVWHSGADTGFTFVGLKSLEPDTDDIGCMWQDSLLLIQNYGNAMNEYQRFACSDKYLELRRQ